MTDKIKSEMNEKFKSSIFQLTKEFNEKLSEKTE